MRSGSTAVNAEAPSCRSSSVIVLWTCIALFFARVVGQIEVLVLEPDWLPALPAWYSGLLPYPILLPVQIALLMVMCVLAIRTSADRVAAPVIAKTCRVLALVYFTAMAARLLLCIYMHGRDYYLMEPSRSHFTGSWRSSCWSGRETVLDVRRIPNERYLSFVSCRCQIEASGACGHPAQRRRRRCAAP